MNLSSAKLKQANRKKVFLEIYEKKAISKNSILENLKLSIPTITQNLKELENEGLIIQEGYFKSTGGRPATIYKSNEKACIAIGMDLQPNSIEIASIDMYGRIIEKDSLSITFTNSDSYFKTLGSFVNEFIHRSEKHSSTVLGVGIAVPGIIASDENHMLYSQVLKTSDFTLSDLAKYIETPRCHFYHNAESGAFAEIWHGKIDGSALMLFLDNCLCNALILNGKVYQGILSSGTIEHMVLHPGGETCYCGKKGCVDAYCSASGLSRMMKQDNLDEFFIDLRNGDSEAGRIWSKYLEELALAIDNCRMIIASDVILSGMLQKYLTSEDFEILKSLSMSKTTFKNADFNITNGVCGRNAIVIGAAIPLMKEFLHSCKLP
ncbi:Sugar kinase of the NBD/HSP70 family, may contain an N-terminal HTH domain [Sphaerochaeta associata]|nr:ROK family transcriptional regulator [Clostridia bacterium]SMP41704.1 Sugar kinase of the NBD/HSP70 family, may contain an N-terminal HTH domain [Sphaerochaeta associata]